MKMIDDARCFLAKSVRVACVAVWRRTKMKRIYYQMHTKQKQIFFFFQSPRDATREERARRERGKEETESD